MLEKSMKQLYELAAALEFYKDDLCHSNIDSLEIEWQVQITCKECYITVVQV